MDGFSVTVEDFDVDWLTEGPAKGQARKFVSHLDYTTADGESGTYDLRVNHPLTIGGTEVFLIGHGYAPVVTITRRQRGRGLQRPDDLPADRPDLRQLRRRARPRTRSPARSPWRARSTRRSRSATACRGRCFGDAVNPLLSLFVYTGDLGLDDGGEPVGLRARQVERHAADEGRRPAVAPRHAPGDTVELPDGLGTVTFDGVERWNKMQISETPGKLVALAGVVLALVGLLGSLFIRPRRLWVRARRSEDGDTVVDVAALDRSNGGDPDRGAARARGDHGHPARRFRRRGQHHQGELVTDASWETLSNQAVAAAAVVYFLALMAHLVQWASLRKLPADEVVTTGVRRWPGASACC